MDNLTKRIAGLSSGKRLLLEHHLQDVGNTGESEVAPQSALLKKANRDVAMAPSYAQERPRIEGAPTAAFPDAVQRRPPGTPGVLSWNQQYRWQYTDMSPASKFFSNVSVAVRLNGTLDIEVLEKALNEMIRRHEALRSGVAVVDDRPILVVRETYPAIQLKSETWAGTDSELRQLMIELTQQRIALEHPPLLRTRVFLLANQEWVLFFVFHHQCCDGWSLSIFFDELTEAYEQLLLGQSVTREASLQYSDYAFWHRKLLESDYGNFLWNFWRQQLAGVQFLNLPTDLPRQQEQTYEGESISFSVSGDIVLNVRRASREKGFSLLMFSAASFGLIMGLYSGQMDFAIGTVLSGRSRPELESMFGYLARTVPLRCKCSPTMRLSELLEDMRARVTDALNHQEFPWGIMYQEFGPKAPPEFPVFVQASVYVHNLPNHQRRTSRFKIKRMPIDVRKSKEDMILNVVEHDDGIDCFWKYNSGLFLKSTINVLIGAFHQALQLFVQSPATSIEEAAGLVFASRKTDSTLL